MSGYSFVYLGSESEAFLTRGGHGSALLIDHSSGNITLYDHRFGGGPFIRGDHNGRVTGNPTGNTVSKKTYTNDPHDKYQQFRFDFRNLTYFIDDEGYLVARLNKTYDHTTNGPK